MMPCLSYQLPPRYKGCKGHTEELVVSSLNRLVDCVDQPGEVDGDDND
jgi:hypothetical protein